MSKARLIQRAALALTAASGVWALLLIVAGGFDVSVAGLSVTANDPYRPLLAASLAATVYILAGGTVDVELWGGWLRTAAGPAGRAWLVRVLRARNVAWAAAVATTVIAWVYGTKAVGGADSYGYLSQSDLWVEGELRVRQPIVAEVPWPDAGWTFAPVGSYRPMSAFRRVQGEDRWSMVPVYPPGLPMMLALAGAVGGIQAKFLVFPLLAGVLVLATYGIGVRTASEWTGAVGAVLVATAPAALFMMVSPMSDVAVSGLVAAAFYLSLGPGALRAAGAGSALAMAVLTRPNLVPLAGVLGLAYAWRLRHPDARRQSLGEGALFALTASIGVVTLAAVNHYLYGSPTGSGYGNLSTLFSISNVPQNARQYLGWLVETQTPLAVVGLAAAVVPLRSLWPRAGIETRLAMALSVVVVWTTYLFYVPWDAWWYLRFLLPASPFVALGLAAAIVSAARFHRQIGVPMALAAVLLLGLFQVRTAVERSAFDLWVGERRYVAGARMTNRLTERNSLIFTGIHVGSVRYYGSRMSVYVEAFPHDWLDRSIAWLARRGVHPYLLLEEWELPTFRERFAGEDALKILERSPIAIHQDPGPLLLFDLLATEDPATPPAIWRGVDEGLWAAPKAPAPRLELQPSGKAR